VLKDCQTRAIDESGWNKHEQVLPSVLWASAYDRYGSFECQIFKLHRYTPLYRYDQTCALDSLTYNCYNVRGDYSMMPEFTPEIELEYISEKNILFTFLKRMNSHSHDNEDANVPLIFLWLYSWISRINRFCEKKLSFK